MKNIISYIGKLLAKEFKGNTRSAATHLIKISIDDLGKMNSARNGNPRNREYNKHNLWVAFRYNGDAVQSDKTSGEYFSKSHNEATPVYQDNC